MKTIMPAVMLMTLFAAASALPAAVTVRVQKMAGGPQICVDGKPIPPRMFFGSAGSGQVAVGEQWSEESFEFTPAVEVNGNGTLHFRFGQKPGEVWLSDLRLTETATGRDVLPQGSFTTSAGFAKTWNIFPPDQRNTVGKAAIENGVLHVTLTKPATGGWPDFHIHSNALTLHANQRYRCSFRVRGIPDRSIIPAVYRVDSGVWSHIGGPPGAFLKQVALARDAGVNLVTFSAPNCWTPPDQKPDYTPIDTLCRQIIEVNPHVLLVPRIGANAPNWWLEEHPEARMVYEGNKPGTMASVSDRRYRADAAAAVERLCRHLCESFPDHFAGIHPCGQNTGEWFYENAWEAPLNGYDPATLKAWRAWLKAHGAPAADTAEVPSAASRHAAPFGFLRDPAQERRLIDFARFQQEEMADMVLALAHGAREGSDGKKLVVFFYGYHYEFGALRNGAAVAGHYAVRKLLGSPDIDILCSPISYFDRQWLGTGPCMSSAESILGSGILWLNEDDTRTYLSGTKDFGGLADLRQTQEVMLRNTAQEALRGFGTWWMDLPGQGWFADARIWDEMRALHPVDAAMAQRPQPFTPEIAAILGEDSMCHLTGGSNVVSRPLVYDSRAALGRSGAPYGQYMLADAVAGKVPAKLQIYLAAWALTPEQRQELKANRQPGTTRVWCWAPGYLLPDRADVAAMSGVTGFQCRKVSLKTAVATPTAAGRKLGLKDPWGPQAEIKPLFSADSSRVRVEATPEQTLATYSDGSPAVAVRRGSNGVDVFVGVPQLTSDLVRALARIAGVHLFTTVDAAVWAAAPYLSIHAVNDGPITIDTGRAAPVVDALNGTSLGTGPEIVLPIQKGETRVLRY